jgi:hypothetical protein
MSIWQETNGAVTFLPPVLGRTINIKHLVSECDFSEVCVSVLASE